MRFGRRWEYGVGIVSEHGGFPREIVPVADEDAARSIVAESQHTAILFRRPQPRPWQLAPNPMGARP